MMSVDDAIAILNRVMQAKGQSSGLSDIQTLVLKQSWAGKSYNDMAEASGYQYDYIKQVGSQLWRSLTQLLGQPVAKSNVQSALQQYIQQHAQLSPQTSETPIAAASSILHHNLPNREFHTLVGRDAETARLLEMLVFDHPLHCVSIEGLGGIGKTTLALAIAYHCLNRSSWLEKAGNSQKVPHFDAIVFTSAKPQRLTPHGILPRLKAERRLQDIFRAIAHTLACPDLLLAGFEEQLEQIQQRLARQRTLLIIDHLDAIDEPDQVLAFLYELPSTVKVIVTSRKQTPFSAIGLAPLSTVASLRLIVHQAQAKELSIQPNEAQTIAQRTNGIPAAIVYAIGHLAAGYPLHDIPARLMNSEFCRFYFDSSVAPLKGTLPHRLLMAMALFPQSATANALAYIAESPNPTATTEGLARLQQLSLLQLHQGRYTMLSLTREYAIAELNAHPDFQQTARQQWLAWYMKFAELNGGKDLKDWHDYSPFDQEWETLEDVIEWCITQNHYADVRQFWRYVNCYSHARGYRGDRRTYWSTRLDWTDWLIQAAEQQQDWQTALDAMFDRAWTLTLMGQPKHLAAADDLFKKAWNLRDYHDVPFQIDLAIHIAVLNIQQQHLDVALRWLQNANALIDEASLNQSIEERQRIHVHYYQGEIAYKTGNYAHAKTLFQHVLKQAEAIGWQRAVFLAKDWLADTALKQGHLDAARSLLEEGLHVAEAKQDECRAAYCKRSIATLEKQCGNLTVAHRWANAARQSFEKLGMLQEAEEAMAIVQ